MDYEFYELLGEKARDIITDILASWYNFTVAQSLILPENKVFHRVSGRTQRFRTNLDE